MKVDLISINSFGLKIVASYDLGRATVQNVQYKILIWQKGIIGFAPAESLF